MGGYTETEQGRGPQESAHPPGVGTELQRPLVLLHRKASVPRASRPAPLPGANSRVGV